MQGHSPPSVCSCAHALQACLPPAPYRILECSPCAASHQVHYTPDAVTWTETGGTRAQAWHIPRPCTLRWLRAAHAPLWWLPAPAAACPLDTRPIFSRTSRCRCALQSRARLPASLASQAQLHTGWRILVAAFVCGTQCAQTASISHRMLTAVSDRADAMVHAQSLRQAWQLLCHRHKS